MGANIYWRPVVEATNSLEHVWAPSSFIKAIESAFGQLPVKLSESHIPVLQGMAAVHGDKEHNPYQELIDKICSVGGTIEVWAEY